MTQLYKNIYTINVPLKNSPLRWINDYIIKDGDRGLLIDTAFNNDESEQAIMDALAELSLTIENTDIFVTHMHVDHSGLVDRLKRHQNKVYASSVDSKMINGFQKPEHWDWIIKNNAYTGTPAEHALPYTGHVAFANRPSHAIEFDILDPGDKFSFGGYDFDILDLRGHSPGQIGLYSQKDGVLFCGDHILDRITPNITAWDLEGDYLACYLKNLAEVGKLDIKHLYTAHRELPDSAAERIAYLQDHHKVRLQQTRDILKSQGPKQTAYEVGRLMDWAIKKGFDEFPLMQKWFACSETLAHLQYLYFAGEADREWQGEALAYTLK